MFGFKPSLQIQQNRRFRTSFGGLISIMVLGLIFYSVWHFGQELIYRIKPRMIISNYNDPDPLKINFTEQNFAFAISLQDPNYNFYLDETIYEIEATFSRMKSSNGSFSYENTPLPLIPCINKKISLLPEYFSSLDLAHLMCFKNISSYISGDFARPEWNYINILFKRCKNSTDNNNHCKSPKEIQDKISGGYMGLYMSNQNIDPVNYTNPSSFFGKNIWTTFSANYFK